jgi:hypothetical protein
MQGQSRCRKPQGRRAQLGATAVLLLAAAIGTAEAQEQPDYAERAKGTIAQLLDGREFKPETGCERAEPCAALLAKLRAGQFAVVEPAERSERPDSPSYLKMRRKCPALDPTQIVASHRIFAATRNFAVYRLDPPRAARRGDEILVFRAQHYVGRDARPAGSEEPPTLLPGTFTAMALPSCRLLSTAPAEDGDWFAKHNAIEDEDHASELLKIGERYFVLNLAPIAGPRQPKPSWWYTLELWDLGQHADADLRKQRRVYSFGYKPGVTRAAAYTSPPG